MVFFITLLRALAACLITNAHYTGIYPTDLIANGGLIGDIIFFAVSGYCLYNVKGNFLRWYSKRVVRCYLPVILITAVYMLTGFYSLEEHSFAWWYLYPTYYHFVASIVVLYVPFYIIAKTQALRKRIPQIMLILAVICLAVYLSPIYDKTYYHIDTVREPMIRFLFMESMLLGAYFKQQGEKVMCGFKARYLIGAIGCFVLYFASKLVFSKVKSISNLQILNWVTIFALLYFVFALFAGMEKKLTPPQFLRTIINYLATITLEIYVVQYVIIDLVRPRFSFPLNWIVLTASILAAASLLHFVCKGILHVSGMIGAKLAPSKAETESGK